MNGTQEALRKTIPLRRRKILKKSLGNMIVVLLAGGFLTLIAYGLLRIGIVRIPEGNERSANILAGLWFVFLGLLMFYRMIYQYLYYLAYFYDVDGENLVVRKGVVIKREIIIPFKRITDVYVDQDLWDVILRIYDVHISTPTKESGDFAHIDGVNREGANRLRELILGRIHKEAA